MIRLRIVLLSVGLLLALAGCASGPAASSLAPTEPVAAATAEEVPQESVAESSTAAEAPKTNEATPVATSALAALAPTATVAVSATLTLPAAATDWSSAAAVEGDYIILGNPAAPIRLIDYSDFM